MLHLIPAPLHRLALRIAYRLRNLFRRLFRPRLEGVSVILFGQDGRILLVRHSYGSPCWCLPGGGCARGETPEEAARRELREELGCEIGDVTLVDTIEERLHGARHSAHVLTATARAEPVADRREILEVASFAPGDLPHDIAPFSRKRIERWRALSLE